MARAAMTFLAAGLSATALLMAAPAGAQTPCCTIPAGTEVAVQVVRPISTHDIKTDMAFDLRLAAPVIVDGQVMLPAGTTGVGRVVQSSGPGIGGKGVVSVVGNVVPRDMMALVRAFAAGKFEEALQWHRKLFPLCRDMLGVATNPIPLKTAMKLLGRGNGEMRLPMCPMDAASEAKVKQTLVNYGLLK